MLTTCIACERQRYQISSSRMFFLRGCMDDNRPCHMCNYIRILRQNGLYKLDLDLNLYVVLKNTTTTTTTTNNNNNNNNNNHNHNHNRQQQQQQQQQPAMNDHNNNDKNFLPRNSPQEDWGIDGLGFLPGLCCPHHDRVQSNGILRSTDFEELLKRHPTERGICNLDLFVWEWTLRGFDEHACDGSVPISSVIIYIYLLLLLHDFCHVCHYMSFIYVICIYVCAFIFLQFSVI